MIIGRGGSICLAFLLDMVLGEPPERWHPVCWMGKAVTAVEQPFCGREGDELIKRFAGTTATAGLPLGVFLAAHGISRRLPRPLGFAAEVLGIWTTLATRSLYGGAASVEQGLMSGLVEGREQVAHLVGRDTDTLDETGVARAAIESVAENTNDGVIAPMFYAFIGGAPLALAYKMVNTLDSMVGYRDKRYRDFGWASARLDDIAGYIPARITAGSVVVAGAAAGANPVRAVRVWRKDAGGHDSPNAGVCESAFAGALGVKLGGSDDYGGIRRKRVVIGAGMRHAQPGDIVRAARLMLTAAMTVLTAGMAVMSVGSRLSAVFRPGRRR
jgi:adenosylcobinamide-phosphate synthase